MRHKKKLIIFLAAAVIVATVWFLAAQTGAVDVNEEQTVPVRRGDLMVTVTEGGSIRAKDSIQYKCRVERMRGISDIAILDIVPPGTYVTQEDVDNGMVLVELDSSSLEDRLQEEEMELAGDQENYTAAKEAYDIQVIQNESDSSNARLTVRFALLDLEKYLGKQLAAQLTKNVDEAESLTGHVSPFLEKVKNDPNLLDGSSAGQELKRLRDEIVLAEGNLTTAEDTLAGSEKLHEADYVSDLQLERDRLDVTSRQFSRENAQVNLDLFLNYDFPKNAEQYLSDYVEAGRELERTYAQCRSRLAQAQASLNNWEERYNSQRNFVEELREQIEFCTIRAVAPGLVIYGEGGSGDTFRAMRRGGSGGIIAKGEVVYEGQTIISMPDTAAMVAEISVHETEVDKVRAGQPAQIIMDAFPDRTLHGEVLEVAPLPDQQQGWMNPDLKVYKTLVSIDGTHEFLRTRMSCSVEILVRDMEEVLQVPIQVVANRGGRKVCYVESEPGPEERQVRTGAFTDTMVQIVEGLEEGEQVLMNPPLFDSYSGESGYVQSNNAWKNRRAEDGQSEDEGSPNDGQAAREEQGSPQGRRRSGRGERGASRETQSGDNIPSKAPGGGGSVETQSRGQN
ncbi:efflux RND transporter periplasmic adaptor subunit [Anaerohalosphaera lusitana]|nr:HlyD family efflux transporter periplasmic adaptor subunit [Anaerohalosphaera lusitana]